jgi:hypothetical protein
LDPKPPIFAGVFPVSGDLRRFNGCLCSDRGTGDIHRPSTQSDVEHESAEQIDRSD